MNAVWQRLRVTRNVPTLTDLSNVHAAQDTLLNRTKQHVQVCLMVFLVKVILYSSPCYIGTGAYLCYRGAKRLSIIRMYATFFI